MKSLRQSAIFNKRLPTIFAIIKESLHAFSDPIRFTTVLFKPSEKSKLFHLKIECRVFRVYTLLQMTSHCSQRP